MQSEQFGAHEVASADEVVGEFDGEEAVVLHDLFGAPLGG